jgi:ubiquinone/menaquinone biosynthesis C-methylase UbiE
MSHARFDESYGSNPAENYERFFVRSIGEPLARELVRRANVLPADRVLDVACGTGIVARLLSQEPDIKGVLAGLDPNASMLAVAEALTSPADRIEWYQAAAEKMPLQAESFDVVLCQMGLQFMADRAAALSEMCRVLGDEGRLLLSVPGPMSIIFASLASAMGRHVSPQAAGFVRQVFSLHDVDELRHLLEDAGLVNVSVDVTYDDQKLPPPRDFLWQYVHSTPLAGIVSQTSADAVAACEREVLEAWGKFVRDDVLVHRQRLLVASGTKAIA